MAIVSFSSQALSSYGLNPLPLSWSLSGNSNTVELLTVGTGVQGIAFNALPIAATGTFVTLSAQTGNTFRVDQAYNNTTFALINTDGSTSLFTCLTASGVSTAQSLTANAFDSTWPEVRRKWLLGFN